MTVMTAQMPLPMVVNVPAVLIGAAAAIVENTDGGRVFLHGELCFAWDPEDEAIRRWSAVRLVRMNVATTVAIAAAYRVHTSTIVRWGHLLDQGGIAALASGKTGPNGPSRLLPGVVASIIELRSQGASFQAISRKVGVSVTSVSRALKANEANTPETNPETTDHSDVEPDHSDVETEHSDVETDPDLELGESDSDGQQVEFELVQVEEEVEVEEVLGAQGEGGGAGPGWWSGDDGWDDAARVLPVLPDPADRSAERVAARWGLMPCARPLFAPAARVPHAGLFLALPGLESTGLLSCAAKVLG